MTLSKDEVSSPSDDALAIRLEIASLSLTKEESKPRSNTIETSATSASSSPSISSTPTALNPLNFSLDGSDETSWVAPASQKSLRTHNPIRAIVDPIVANSVKCGKERGDGKDQISLAVSFFHSIFEPTSTKGFDVLIVSILIRF
jgi:hypothetical protein